MSSEVHGVTEGAEGALFTRQATGLVRSVSPLSTLIFNCFTAATPFVLAIALFWSLAVFPGANIYVALILGYLAGMIFAFAISTVTAAIPRSGGDYVFVGRILHPIVGIISSFCFTAGVLLSGAGIAFFLVTAALAPSFNVIGLISGSSTLLDWGTTLSTNRGWQFAAAAIALVLAGLLAGTGWKWSLRVQNVGYALGMISLLVTAIVVLVNSGSDFVHAFNSFANPFTGDANSYDATIAAAKEMGVNVDQGSTFSNTWGAFGAVIGFSIYTFYSTHISGEVRQASTWKTSGVMVGSALINGISVLIMTVIFFYGFGSQFFVSINAVNGTDAYPFAAPPFYVFLTSIAGDNSVLAWFLGIAIVMTFFVVLWLQFIQPMRALFAYAFDGVLPLRVAYVSPRSRVPVVSLLIAFVIMLGLLVWAVYGGNFFTVYATGVFITAGALIPMSLAVIFFAHRRPALWRGSAINMRVAGIPLTTLVGVPALAVAIAVAFLYLKYPGLGITDRWAAVRNLGIVIGAALVTYLIANYIRGRQGINLIQATSEIPPD